jgi:hypothetical protein
MGTWSAGRAVSGGVSLWTLIKENVVVVIFWDIFACTQGGLVNFNIQRCLVGDLVYQIVE